MKLERTQAKGSFHDVDSQLLLQMVDISGLSPHMLSAIHTEICSRRPPGWKTMEASLRQRYKAAKHRDLEMELSAMAQLAQGPAQQVAEPKLSLAVESQQIALPLKAAPPPTPIALPVPLAAAPKVHVIPKRTFQAGPSSWEEAAKLVRHAKVHADAKDLDSRLKDVKNWAQISPLRLLGYSVSATDGLSLNDRREFLKDFCENAQLPLGLPKDYAVNWCAPGSKGRVLRTARHLQFLVKTFTQQNNRAYDNAIATWQQDWTYLREEFGRLAPVIDWLNTRN